MRRLARSLRTVPASQRSFPLLSLRSLHDNGLWGFQRPRHFQVPDFSPEELANRIKHASLMRLVEMYRRHGHRAAKLDPLDLAERPNVAALDPRRFGFDVDPSKIRPDFVSETLPAGQLAPADEPIDIRGLVDFPDGSTHKTAEQIASWLAEVYCSGLGFDFHHLPSKHARRFLESTLEKSHQSPVTETEQLEYWKVLAMSEGFDKWCAKRFPNVKRYGLEGGESMMVALKVLHELAAQKNVKDVVIAMPHRGRLNLLTQMLELDMRLLVRKMRGQTTLPDELAPPFFLDDVLSHLFISSPLNPTVHLLPNPSHLEAVNPVGLGFARALQVPHDPDTKELGEKVLSVQIHGDAAFQGQGVTAETLNLEGLPHFTVGGSIRIVVNNQLGYTTPATAGRTSLYATDLAKSIAAPIIHVNGDRVDDVARAVRLAFAYQQKFRKDVVVDLVVYRRRGHNELDEPAYTSPAMYKTIEKLPSVPQLYEQQLLSEGTLTPERAESFKKEHFDKLDESLEASKPENFKVPPLPMYRGWDKMIWPDPNEWTQQVETGVDLDTLKQVGKRSAQLPDGFNVHPRLSRMHIAKRLASLESGAGIDFSTAEALAFGTLTLEGYHIRLSGQDSGRGTFSQRHAIMTDQSSDRLYAPLQSLTTDPTGPNKSQRAGTFEVVNSPLSEYAVVGFEQGVGWVSPNILPLWEAQFGDFHNTAQVVIDTFLGGSESKWGMQSALTLLLPHGYDSAGPEHSSARIERFLQLTNEPMSREAFVPNMHCVNVTTASQYFHLLRRQLVRPYRKPLVVFSPKGILRLPAAASRIESMAPGTTFEPVLDDTEVRDPAQVDKVVLLSGKMYYDLVKERQTRKLEDKIAFIRVEELSPFPYDAIEAVLSRYTSAKKFAWAQEEPENAGAWSFVAPRLRSLKQTEWQGVTRPALATPAPGVNSIFQAQKAEILRDIFKLQ